MKKMNFFGFIKTTLVGGVLFLLPLALGIIALEKLLRLVTKLTLPLAKALHMETLMGSQASYLLAVIVLVLAGFLAGLAAKTRLGVRFKTWIENFILGFVPGYTMIKGFVGQDGQHSKVSTALIGENEKWEIGFIVERHENGYYTVFKPGAPNPTSGSVLFVSPDQVREIDVTVKDAMKCLRQDGGGSADLLEGKFPH